MAVSYLVCSSIYSQWSEETRWGRLWLPVAAIFLHNTTNVLWGQINMNASWCGTHRRTGGSGGTSAPLPPLIPSNVISIFFSTREMAFVLVYGIVHHSGTKRLNQVAWSNSPWGFGATETRDYSLTVPVLQRTPLWHSTMHKPFSNAFPQCKTAPAPWDFFFFFFCNGREKIQKSIRHAPY